MMWTWNHTRKLSRDLRVTAAIAAIVVVSFGYGAAVGVYKWPPYTTLKAIHNGVLINQTHSTSESYRGEREILDLAFAEPLISGDQLNAPISSIDGIHQAVSSLALPVEDFYDSYGNIEIIDVTRLVLDGGTANILNITYDLGGSRFDAYAYVLNGVDANDAALIIPGSGFNQSSAIYRRDATNYHYGITEALGSSVAKYVLIKPNEDHVAFHDGSSKLSQDFYINWLLNSGSSYSVHYIVGSLAITKYLQENFDRVIIAGLSQGGAAALLNAIQSQPDVAIIASGFSVITSRVRWAGHNQIIIPGLERRLGIDKIRRLISTSPTSFLFTYGMAETGIYRMEAEEEFSCQFLALNNVTCAVHDEAHVFPVHAIRQWLGQRDL